MQRSCHIHPNSWQATHINVWENITGENSGISDSLFLYYNIQKFRFTLLP